MFRVDEMHFGKIAAASILRGAKNSGVLPARDAFFFPPTGLGRSPNVHNVSFARRF